MNPTAPARHAHPRAHPDPCPFSAKHGCPCWIGYAGAGLSCGAIQGWLRATLPGVSSCSAASQRCSNRLCRHVVESAPMGLQTALPYPSETIDLQQRRNIRNSALAHYQGDAMGSHRPIRQRPACTGGAAAAAGGAGCSSCGGGAGCGMTGLVHELSPVWRLNQ